MLMENKAELPAEERRDSEDGVDLGWWLKHLAAHAWWLIICVLVTTAAAVSVVVFTHPIYRATAVLTSESTERGEGVAGISLSGAGGALGGLASNLGLGMPRDAETQEALAVLRSRELTENFIKDKNLMPKLFPSQWDSAAGRWKEGQEPTLAKGYRYFDKKIRTIIDDKKTQLITLQIDWTDRAEAAQWAIELVERVNQEMRTRSVTKADASLHFLEEELQGSSQIEVRTAVAHLMEAQIKKRMLAHVTQDYSFGFVDRPVATDGEKPIWPEKVVLLTLGPLGGLAIGIMLVLIFRPLPRRGAR